MGKKRPPPNVVSIRVTAWMGCAAWASTSWPISRPRKLNGIEPAR